MQFHGRRVHFVGIGGAGLSAIARVLMEQGAEVSGSDLVRSPVAEALAQDGARVFAGHQAENVDGAELVVVSSAVPASNVELQAAQAAGIPVLKRPQVLDPPDQLAHRRDHRLERLEPLHYLPGGLLVVPEGRRGHPLLDGGHLLLARGQVKESPGSSRSGR